MPVYKDYVKNPYGASMKAGLVSGGVAGAGLLGGALAKSKTGKIVGNSLFVAGTGLGIFSTLNQIRSAKKLGSKKSGGGISGFFGQNIASYAGGVAGNAAGFLGAALGVQGAQKLHRFARIKKAAKYLKVVK